MDEFWTHQIPPNLGFCLSLSKEKTNLFILKNLTLFLRTFFCSLLQYFLIQQIDLKSVSCSIISNLVFNPEAGKVFKLLS